MSLQNLWAGWRSEYIVEATARGCSKKSSRTDRNQSALSIGGIQGCSSKWMEYGEGS